MMFSDDAQSSETPDDSRSSGNAAKITARMLKIRELIEQGEYPDRDELAERIVDARSYV